MSVVVNAAYYTAGNGGRKVVKLANGNIIVIANDIGTMTTYFYKSTDDGANFTQMCYVSGSYRRAAICSYGNTVYLLFNDNDTKLYSLTIDTTTVTNVDQIANVVTVDTQTGFADGVSLANVGTTLHGAWSSYNETYPDSPNLRYSTSIDGGANWAAVTQLTTDNDGDIVNVDPCIRVSDGNPVIAFNHWEGSVGGHDEIRCMYYAEGWHQSTVSDGGDSDTYSRGHPCMGAEATTHLVCFYDGNDVTDPNAYNIRCSESTDGGANWGAETKLTSGNTYDQAYPSAGVALNDDIYLYWQGDDGEYNQIRRMVRTSGTWGAVADLTAYTTNDGEYVGAMAAQVGTMLGYVWMNRQDGTVEFDKETIGEAEAGHAMTSMSKYW